MVLHMFATLRHDTARIHAKVHFFIARDLKTKIAKGIRTAISEQLEGR